MSSESDVRSVARRFPVLSRRTDAPKSVPWAMLAPHEARAKTNHGQTLERLAERGGLAPGEIFAVVHDVPWSCAPRPDGAIAWLHKTLQGTESESQADPVAWVNREALEDAQWGDGTAPILRHDYHETDSYWDCPLYAESPKVMEGGSHTRQLHPDTAAQIAGWIAGAVHFVWPDGLTDKRREMAAGWIKALHGDPVEAQAMGCWSVFSDDDLRRILEWHEEVRSTCGISADDDNLRKRIVGALRNTEQASIGDGGGS